MMKRMLPTLVSAFVLFVATGCDPTKPSSDVKTLLAAQGVNSTAVGDQLQTQLHLRLMDGSCAGDGNQYQYQYTSAGTPGDGNGANGQGGGDQLRLRDGSCGDGGG